MKLLKNLKYYLMFL